MASPTRKYALLASLGLTVIGFVIYSLAFVAEGSSPLLNLLRIAELKTYDARLQLRGRQQASPDIVIVAIDQKSQESLGRWPFPRSNFAKMLDGLREDGARVVAFDITFPKPDESTKPIQELRKLIEEDQGRGKGSDAALLKRLTELEQRFSSDDQFADAIRRSGKVVLGSIFLYTDEDLKGVGDETLDRSARLLAYFPYPQVRAVGSREQASYLAVVQTYEALGLLPRGTLANIDVLSEALRGQKAGTGFFNTFLDTDGVVRQATVALPYGRSRNRAEWDFYPSLDVQAVRFFLDTSPEQFVLNFAKAEILSVQFGSRGVVETDLVGRLPINYQGAAHRYKYVSMADVVNRNFPPGTFKDKLVLVGASSPGIGDIWMTPFGLMPGVEIHANVMDMMLKQQFIQHGGREVAVDLGFILLFGLGMGFVLVRVRLSWIIPLTIGVLTAFAVLTLAAFLEYGAWLNLVVPTCVLLTGSALVTALRLIEADKDRNQLRSTLGERSGES